MRACVWSEIHQPIIIKIHRASTDRFASSRCACAVLESRIMNGHASRLSHLTSYTCHRLYATSGLTRFRYTYAARAWETVRSPQIRRCAHRASSESDVQRLRFFAARFFGAARRVSGGHLRRLVSRSAPRPWCSRPGQHSQLHDARDGTCRG